MGADLDGDGTVAAGGADRLPGAVAQRIEIASDQLTAGQAAEVISSLLSRPVQVTEPQPGQVNPLSTWLEQVGPAIDITALRRRAGIGKVVIPHTLRHAFITAAPVWTPGCRLVMCKRPPRMPIRGPQ